MPTRGWCWSNFLRRTLWTLVVRPHLGKKFHQICLIRDWLLKVEINPPVEHFIIIFFKNPKKQTHFAVIWYCNFMWHDYIKIFLLKWVSVCTIHLENSVMKRNNTIIIHSTKDKHATHKKPHEASNNKEKNNEGGKSSEGARESFSFRSPNEPLLIWRASVWHVLLPLSDWEPLSWEAAEQCPDLLRRLFVRGQRSWLRRYHMQKQSHSERQV